MHIHSRLLFIVGLIACSPVIASAASTRTGNTNGWPTTPEAIARPLGKQPVSYRIAVNASASRPELHSHEEGAMISPEQAQRAVGAEGNLAFASRSRPGVPLDVRFQTPIRAVRMTDRPNRFTDTRRPASVFTRIVTDNRGTAHERYVFQHSHGSVGTVTKYRTIDGKTQKHIANVTYSTFQRFHLEQRQSL